MVPKGRRSHYTNAVLRLLYHISATFSIDRRQFSAFRDRRALSFGGRRASLECASVCLAECAVARKGPVWYTIIEAVRVRPLLL